MVYKKTCACFKNQCKHYWVEYNKLRPGHSTPGMHQKRFGGLRQIILQRDNFQCVRCGMTRQEHKDTFGRDVTVNHIDKQGRYSDKQNNDLNNLETLCLRCHGSKDAIQHGKYATYNKLLLSKGV